MKKTFLILAIVLLLAANSFAGDYANLNFIGFSKDGKFLAFEEYGTGDGAGFPYSNIYFINTEKNAFAASPVTVFIENETATETQARNKAKFAAAKKLRDLKIVNGNTGTHAVSHLLTDFTSNRASSAEVDVVRFAEIVASMYRSGDYELSLKPILTKSKDCEIYGFDTYKFELTLKDNENKLSRFLQKDAELPKSRGCALGYAIQDVYIFEDNLVTFLNVFKPGFEGPDMRFMAVSGKLKDIVPLPIVR